MKEFGIDPTFLGGLTDEQKKALNETLLQHKSFLDNENKSTFDTRIASEKTKWEQEQKNKLDAENKQLEWLKKIGSPENQIVAKELIEAGRTPEQIQEKFPNWFGNGTKQGNETKQGNVVLDLNKLLNGEVVVSNSQGKPGIESDEVFLKRINENGIADDASDDWNRYDQLSKEGKLK